MVSPAICGTLLARFGTPAQRERWLPPIASGERKMVFAITEPDAGSNTHRLETVATRDGDGWRLSGRKYYISGVDEADAVLVVSRTGAEEGAGRGRLSLFIVDTDAPGWTGPRSSSTSAPPIASSSCSWTTSASTATGSWVRRATGSARSSTASTPSGSSAPPSATASPATP